MNSTAKSRAIERSGTGTRPTVLLTGFGPFPGIPVNATADLVPEIAKRARRRFKTFRIVSEILPTEWTAGLDRLDQLLQRHAPVIALHFGVDATAIGFEIETVGENVCAAREDACGALPNLDVVVARGAASLPVKLPVDAIIAALAEQGIPASASDSAGKYLCNAVLYHSLHSAEASPGRRAGFIHLPPDLEDSALSRDAAIAGALTIIGLCLRQTEDNAHAS